MTDDPYLWLEDVTGEAALAWARARNAQTEAALEAQPGHAATVDALLAIFNARDRIPQVTRRADWLYNFWQDSAHKRGILRRTTLVGYRANDVAWETVLDLDALSALEHESWSWKGMTCLGPSQRLCLVHLARGGADATVVREFDSVEKRFVDDGFTLPEAKASVTWIDADTIYVGTDVGPGSLTDSGYPRIVKRWSRGTPLGTAATVFEAQTSDVSADISVDDTPGFERTIVQRTIAFWNVKRFLLTGDALLPIDVPDDCDIDFMRDALLIHLRSDWTVGGTTYASGSLLVTDADNHLAGKREFSVLFAPTVTRSLAAWAQTRDHVLLDVLDNVASRIEEWRKDGSAFTRRDVAAPFPGTLGIGTLYDARIDGVPAERGKPAVPASTDASLAERYWLTYVDFLTPDALWLGTAGSDARDTVKTRQPLFDASGLHVDQRFATSRDGARVPYFVVWPRGSSAEVPGDGTTPTLLYGYGGFEISLNPSYLPAQGSQWLAHGGIYVQANIRGGGEFGPAWHEAAVGAHKQRSYDDFIAIAEDLIAHGITSPAHLGIQGGSNGGLLVGAVMLQRPDLFNAVVCQAPLLDMKRFSHLLAGASWMAEYGNPDVPAEWEVIAKYSPYQNVRPGVRLPPVLFTTSTRDDRVHPGHARKLAARMIANGNNVLFHENIEGGHAGADDNEQRAKLGALVFSFLRRQLGH